MTIITANLAEQDEPQVDQCEDDIQLSLIVYSHSLERNVAYQLSHKELRECSLGKLDFNSIVNFMIHRLREGNGEAA